MKLFPESWDIEEANKLCSHVIDCINKTAPIVDYETPFKMIRTTNVKNGRISLDDARNVDEATFIKWNRRLTPRLNDIVLTREAPLGDVGLIRGSEKIMLGQRIMLYRANPKLLDQHFLYYSLLGPTLQAQLKTLGSGSTVEHVRVPDAGRLLIPYPELKTQKKIAAILSAYDDLIENNKRRIALLEKMAEEIYREWFVRFRFPGYQTAEFEKGIPKGWSFKSISSLCREVRTSIKKKNLKDREIYLGLEHLSRASITVKSNDFTDSINSDKLKFQYRDILFGKIRPYLHKICLASFSGTCSTDIIVLRPTQKQYEGFLLFSVFSDTFVELATTSSKGTKMPRADWDFLNKLEIAIPDEEILAKFQSQFDIIFEQLEILLKSNQALENTKRLLLPRLISGKLSVEQLDIQFPPSMQDENSTY